MTAHVDSRLMSGFVCRTAFDPVWSRGLTGAAVCRCWERRAADLSLLSVNPSLDRLSSERTAAELTSDGRSLTAQVAGSGG